MILLLACTEPGPAGTSDAAADASFPAVAWGDLHVHTNLSYDGCEDPDAACQPEGEVPGEHAFAHAAEAGLDFVALTDHAEFGRYTRPAAGQDLDVWEQQKAWIRAAEGGPVLPILGYEWTAGGGHRTVIFEDVDACEGYRVGARPKPVQKEALGFEDYVEDEDNGVNRTVDLVPYLQSVDCTATRWNSFFHHPAMVVPSEADWANPDCTTETDTVVEIASEHGVSECADPAAEHCDFRLPSDIYVVGGSVQSALQLGRRLGFVGGSDTHQSRPGPTAGPGWTGLFEDTDGDGVDDTTLTQFSAGAATGVLYDDGSFDRADVFDALDVRRTVATTWLLDDLRAGALADDGTLYLPGADVPAGTVLTPVLSTTDAGVADWVVDVLAADGSAADLAMAAGEVRYLRARFTADGTEQRLWVSPFFGY